MERIAAGEYAVAVAETGFQATNRAQDLRVALRPDGVAVSSRIGGEVAVRFSLRAWGRSASMPVEPVVPRLGPCLAGGAVDAFGACLRRVEYPRPGLTEWWENRPDGLEQGFTIASVPAGSGHLVLDVDVAGADPVVSHDESLLRRESGDWLRYGGLAAWDASGRALPAWMEPIAHGVRLVVDDAGAIGEITVDPVVAPAAWTAEGDQALAYFGFSLASAGDVNGDGYGDVVVGAYAYENGITAEGKAFAYHGGPAGLDPVAAWSAEGELAGAYFGWSVASAGDTNGDGFEDVIIGAPGFSGPQVGEGRASVYLGSATGLESTPIWTAEAQQANAEFGSSVASAGDTNGDGFDEVLVGAYLFDNGEVDEGRAFLYLGTLGGPADSASWTAESDQAGAWFGVSVAPAGDVDDDGIADVAVGASKWDGPDIDEGKASVFLGASGGLGTTPAWTVESDQARAAFGGSLSGAGDVNGDGIDDLLVGAYSFDNGQSDEGRAFLYLGGSGGLATSAIWTAESDQASAYFGFSVAGVGDVDGDGFADALIGAYLYDNGQSDEGRASLFRGASTGLGFSSAWTAESDQGDAFLGHAVASGGDVNGDGFADILIGAYLFDNVEENEGRAWLYLGTGVTLYEDADEDGFGNPDVHEVSGRAPAGYVADNTDCDDSNADAFPGAVEVGGNGVDEDCAGDDAPAPPDTGDTAPPPDTGPSGDTAVNPGRWVPRGCSTPLPVAPAGLAWVALAVLRRRSGRRP